MEKIKFDKKHILKEITKYTISFILGALIFNAVFFSLEKQNNLPYDVVPLIFNAVLLISVVAACYQTIRYEKYRVKTYNNFIESYKNIEYNPVLRRQNKKIGYEESIDIVAYLQAHDSRYGGFLKIDGIEEDTTGERIMLFLDSYYERQDIERRMKLYARPRKG